MESCSPSVMRSFFILLDSNVCNMDSFGFIEDLKFSPDMIGHRIVSVYRHLTICLTDGIFDIVVTDSQLFMAKNFICDELIILPAAQFRYSTPHPNPIAMRTDQHAGVNIRLLQAREGSISFSLGRGKEPNHF
jgi:hypothetical protein